VQSAFLWITQCQNSRFEILKFFLRIIVAGHRLAKDSHLRESSVNFVWVALLKSKSLVVIGSSVTNCGILDVGAISKTIKSTFTGHTVLGFGSSLHIFSSLAYSVRGSKSGRLSDGRAATEAA
jgi:hypothetical protein